MELNLSKKCFIVTGGTSGIGAAITKALLSEDARVLVATFSPHKQVESFLTQIQDKSHIELILGDLSNEGQCKKVVEKCIESFGGIHGVVNNAGVNDSAGLTTGPGAFRKSLESNLFHYYDLVHYALPYLKNSSGSIINISSKVALTGQGGTSGYAAAKGAQLALTREWAAELAPFNIRVNAILPAEVMTPLYRQWLNKFEDPKSKESTLAKNIPLGLRMTTPEEIAAMTLFLLSDKSSHTTGQWVSVDGGYVHLDRALGN